MEKGSKNIGILTFHRALNYGAFSQAYALKTFLESCGHRVSFVDYWPKAHAETYALFRINRYVGYLGRILRVIRSLLVYSRSKQKKEKMDSEQTKMLGLPLKPEFEFPDALTSINEYDCIIYGSDQIWWNSIIYGYQGIDSVYWGAYIPKDCRKIAYAPSMGIINFSDKQVEEIQGYLQNFFKISVREREMIPFLEPLYKEKISIVLDPIFLLDRHVWKQACTVVSERNYILYYNLMPSPEASKLVRQLKKETGMRVIEVTGRVTPFRFGRGLLQSASTIEWLSLINSAELVVSTSFHGVAFSVLLEKNFYALGMGKKTGRVQSLLQSLGLSERLVDQVMELPERSIDYSGVRLKLNRMKEESISFLCNAIHMD